MPDKDEHLRQFESTLNPTIAKFAPKTMTAASISVLIADIREHAQGMLKSCEELDAAVAASEGEARKAADILISMASRIK